MLSLNQNYSLCAILLRLFWPFALTSVFLRQQKQVMKLVLESSTASIDSELMALAINLATNKRNAQLISEGKFFCTMQLM